MPPKKRAKLNVKQIEDPEIISLRRVSDIAKSLALLIKQRNQYKALTSQLLDITEQRGTIVTLEPKNTENILKKILEWLHNIELIKEKSSLLRDESLKTLRGVDVLDDDALKGAALILTETETRLAFVDGIEHRFMRIVRYKSSVEPIEKHTSLWLKRFFLQWTKTNQDLRKRSLLLNKTLATISMVNIVKDTSI